MTDAELQGIAAQALNLAKRDMERTDFNFLLAVSYQGEPLHRMKKVEALIVEKLGEEWMNSGAAKDAGFSILLTAVDMMPPVAVVFATAANTFAPTKKLLAMPLEAQRAVIDQGHDGHHEAAKRGLLTIRDALVAVAQTPERVCFYNQLVYRGRPLSEPPDVKFFDQAGFDGRMKMFGKGKHSCPPLNLGSEFTSKHGRREYQ